MWYATILRLFPLTQRTATIRFSLRNRQLVQQDLDVCMTDPDFAERYYLSLLT
jgi:hypothetical protein